MKLEIKNVTKSYAKRRVLENVSLELSVGVYGLLGPNGAGKSTLISIITGLVEPDIGAVIYSDESGAKLHQKLGYLPQYQSFYKFRFCHLPIMEQTHSARSESLSSARSTLYHPYSW